jgi:hypothetical protein
MSAADSLVANYDKVAFTTYFDVDKVAVYSSKDDGSGSGIGSGGSLAVPAGTPNTYSITYATVANPYGKRCLPTLSWSLDNVNYYPVNVPIFYFNATFQQYLWQALGFAGCSDDLIYLCCTNSYGSAQTMYMQFALDSPS